LLERNAEYINEKGTPPCYPCTTLIPIISEEAPCLLSTTPKAVTTSSIRTA
jgi:hypothetical protein